MALSLSTKIGEGSDDGVETPSVEKLLSEFDSELTILIKCGTDGFETVYIRIEDILFQLEKYPDYKNISAQFKEIQDFWSDLYHRVRNTGMDSEQTITQEELAKALNGYRDMYRAMKVYKPS